MPQSNRATPSEPELTLQEELAELMRQAAIESRLQTRAGSPHPAVRAYWLERAMAVLAAVGRRIHEVEPGRRAGLWLVRGAAAASGLRVLHLILSWPGEHVRWLI